MRKPWKPGSILLLFPLLLLAAACAAADDAALERHYYAIEVNGTLCGYAHVRTADAELDGKPTILLEQKMVMLYSLLGMEVDTEILLAYHLEPDTGEFVRLDSDVRQGRNAFSWEARIDDGVARVTSLMKEGETEIVLSPDVIRPNPLYLHHLKRDFVDRGLEARTYTALEVQDAELQDTRYTLAGREILELAGRSFEAVKLDSLNEKTGLRGTIWIDSATGQMLKVAFGDNRTAYLTDRSVTKRIQLAEVDETISVKTNVSIPDIHGITYMKVRVVLEPTGSVITRESLNVPGQRFVGTVRENRIEGVFEIEHPRYDGAGAPPFPPDFGGDPALTLYLEPNGMIESADPTLIERAREITLGSADAWEASRRIGAWVADNIDYAIPGGGTARGTHQMRAGECGAHSNLVAALARAVGIPARVIWGGMYTPSLGGAFGQHGWNEVYMGEAGWIPLDSTANETDFVDSGHIRLGVHESTVTSFNALEAEVLEHRLGSAGPPEAVPGKYDAYLGDYVHPRAGKTMRVVVRDGSLAVDVPGRTVLALRDADELDRWYAKLTDRVFATFERDESGRIDEMRLHEIVRLQRIADPDKISKRTPEHLRPYLGTYLLAQLDAEFEVVYMHGGLAVNDPVRGKTIDLEEPDTVGRRADPFGNTYWFEREDGGRYQTMVIDAANGFERTGSGSPPA